MCTPCRPQLEADRLNRLVVDICQRRLAAGGVSVQQIRVQCRRLHQRQAVLTEEV